jgi:hypothetical protein
MPGSAGSFADVAAGLTRPAAVALDLAGSDGFEQLSSAIVKMASVATSATDATPRFLSIDTSKAS